MDWFADLTGLADDALATVRTGVRVDGNALIFPNGRRVQAGRLWTPSLAELPAPPEGPARIRVIEVIADVKALHADPANDGAVFQVASQFNLLEMIGPSVTPEQGIARYATDHTQGPACAMACAAGTIWRNYLVPIAGQVGQSSDRQLDMLADLGRALGNQAGQLWTMRNGYALPQPGALHRISSTIAALGPDTLRPLLRLGVQVETEVTLPQAAGHKVHQVYASALPINYSSEPVTDWEAFARLVLEAAYLGTLGVAAALGARRVYLTRLGGGAFGNPAGWISDAMAKATATWAAADLDLRIVSYGKPDPNNRALLR